jgi:glucosamine-6-phosphate deaminase
MSSRINPPKLIVEDDYKVVSKHVALRISSVIKESRQTHKRPVIGLATGSSPLGVYRELIRMFREGSIDFSDCVFFNLDEYYGVQRTDLQSYYRFMHENFFDYVGVKDDQINIPDGSIPQSQIQEYCLEYEGKIRAVGGIDFQILGIGRDGHIGFNEPGSTVDSRTRLVSLNEVTRRDASPDFFGYKNVPLEAITMGVGTILEAREIVLLVSGEHKAAVLREALERPPTANLPASFLQFHGSVEVLTDRAAASKLTAFRTPWLIRKVDWNKELLVSEGAIIWLALKKDKPINKLEENDFRSEGLGQLYDSLGASFGQNVLNDLKSKIGRISNKIDGKSKQKILIVSPHPDDDVICTGSLMKKLSARQEIHVAYMVSGSNAVRDLDVLNYLALENESAVEILEEWASLEGLSPEQALDSIKRAIYSKSKGEADHPIVRLIKADIRRQEAKRASSKARAITHFLNLPFYEEYGTARKAPISDEDIEITKKFLDGLRPDVIFVAGDTNDPNGTHSMTLTALEEAMKQLPRDYRPTMFSYKGAWEEFTLEESYSVELINSYEMNEKIEMILEHVSQIDPLFPGPADERQFWERARDRNQASAQLLRKLGIDEFSNDIVGAELYKTFDLSFS